MSFESNQIIYVIFQKQMSTDKKIPLGIVHGRFQPPHNGHIQYIVEALERVEHLTIGICTPKICTQEEALETGYPCTEELNPFSYEERVNMISDTLNSCGIAKDRYSIIPFPSDYKNIQKIVPSETIFFISHSGELDSKKKEYLENLGYKTEIILSLDSSRKESGQKIRDMIKNKDNLWKSLVPESVKKRIEELVSSRT